MGSKTKKILFGAILFTVFSVSLCAFLVYQIKNKGMLLEEQVRILAENNSKEKVYLDVKRTIQETEMERSYINSRFFKDENDSINFLNEIENLAPQLGLEFKTKSLETILDENKKPQSLKMSFTYIGKESTVRDFTKMLENLQYHSYLENLSLKKSNDSNWEGNATLYISIDPS